MKLLTEILSEISKAKLDAYSKEARWQNLDLSFNKYEKASPEEKEEIRKIILKRKKGLNMAHTKLTKKDFDESNGSDVNEFRVGERVKFNGKLYKIYKVEGTTLHAGKCLGGGKTGPVEKIHTSKVEKVV